MPVAEDAPIEEAALVDLPTDPFAAVPASDAAKATESAPDTKPVSDADAFITPAADEISAEKSSEALEVGDPPGKNAEADGKAPDPAETTPAAKEAETVTA